MSPHCYLNLKTGGLFYRKNDPGNEFKQFLKIREEAENKSKFDEDLKNSLQLTHKDILDEKNIWEIFEEKIMKYSPLLCFKDFYYEHILCLSRGFIKEGVFHLELRDFLNVLVDEVFNFPIFK